MARCWKLGVCGVVESKNIVRYLSFGSTTWEFFICTQTRIPVDDGQAAQIHFRKSTDEQLATMGTSSNYNVSNPAKYRHMLVCAKRKSTRMNYVKKYYHKKSTKISCNFNLFLLLSFHIVMCYNVCALANNFAHLKINRHMFSGSRSILAWPLTNN